MAKMRPMRRELRAIDQNVIMHMHGCDVPLDDAPSELYYTCQFHSSMTGVINIVDDNSNGSIITTNSTNSSTSPPSYGYSLELDLAFDNNQDFILTSGYDL